MSSSVLNFEDTTHEDLISGQSPWAESAASRHFRPHREPAGATSGQTIVTDVAVIGGGVTGALIAEHLTARGRSVVLLDREELGLGSTQASTALLQWEIDTSLQELTDLYGFEKAAHVYRRSRAAVAGLTDLVRDNRIACSFVPRPSLYLAAGQAGEKALAEELSLRHRAGLEGLLLPYCRLRRDYGFDREAAILSPGCAEADPLALCWSLLTIARNRGARLLAGNAEAFHEEAGRVVIEACAPDGAPMLIDAGHAVLATGYVMPHFVMPEVHSTASTYALTTVPQAPDIAWTDRALVWEAADPYLYMRLTEDNRIILGGEDEDIADPDQRDALLPAKIERLRARLAATWPKADTTLSHAWTGAFGQTSDGLPLIGQVASTRNIFAAYGYGGNGITFSYLASRMIAALIEGRRDAWFDDFALDRDGRAAQS